MAIPDSTFFGPEDISFGQLRQITDPLEKIGLLKKRLDSFFISQIDALDKRSPFVVAIMSCIAIETLGTIFFDKGKDTGQSYRFNLVLAKIDQKFSRPLTKEFKENYKKQWPEKVKLEASTRGDLLYSYLRNTMIHGYYAQGFYLNDEEGFTWKEEEGYFIINPHWLWVKVKDIYGVIIGEVTRPKKQSGYKANALKYLEDICK